jgi:hypothetical protein
LTLSDGSLAAVSCPSCGERGAAVWDKVPPELVDNSWSMLQLSFADAGPTLEELQALRALNVDLHEMTMTDAWRTLSGIRSLLLGPYQTPEARELLVAYSSKGFKVFLVPIDGPESSP